jgi:hypothetical protein
VGEIERYSQLDNRDERMPMEGEILQEPQKLFSEEREMFLCAHKYL